MDSIERMRRINDLTKELRQRGFADSSFEAIQQANQIYGHDELDDHVRHGIIADSQHDKVNRDVNMEDVNSAYNERKLSKLTENMELLTTKMNEIIKAINDIDSRLGDLKSKHDLLAARPAVVQPQAEAPVQKKESKAEFTEIQAEPAQASAPAAHVDADANQRTGGFQSQDVSIDKMFYFGKK